jgi:DNA-directed RNA polymerase subunit RPC12/RpoP
MEKPEPARLSFLVEEKIRLFVYCVDCHHNAMLDAGPIAERLGADFPIPQVAKHVRCAACGSRHATVNPYWNDEDVPGRPILYSYPDFG